MKITFINPNMSSTKSGEAMQPLAFAILKHLTPPEIEIDFYDDRIENIDFEKHTDLAAISCGTFSAKRSYEIALEYRKRNVKVVMGGYHPTLLPYEAKEFADSVVIGNAESVWQQLIKDFSENNLKEFYTSENSGKTFISEYDYSIFDGKKYFPVNMVEWGRGCQHDCDFCSIQAYNNGKVSLRSIDEVIIDIKKFDSKPIFFVDDNLFHGKKVFKELMLALIPLKKRWACQISVDVTKDPELLDLMEKSGCLMVLIGIESLNNSTLEMMNKKWNYNPEKYVIALNEFRKRKIMVYGTFIFGYDQDSETGWKKTVEFAMRNKLFIANFNPLYPMPGTKLYNRLEAEKRLIYEKWWLDSEFYYGKTMFKTKGYSPEQLEIGCFNAKKRFNSYSSILYRATDFKANLGGKTNAIFYFAANLTNRKAIFKKQGKKLGLK